MATHSPGSGHPVPPVREDHRPKPGGPDSLLIVALIVETFEDIGVTRLSRWIFNCYVIHNVGGDPVIVDPGLPGTASELVPIMSALGHAQDAPLAVCATHAHSDHVGGAPELATRGAAVVHLPTTTGGYLEGTRPRSPRLNVIARIWPTLFDQPFDVRSVTEAARGSRVAGYGTSAGMRWPADQPVEFLADGDHLPGAPEWEVIAAPGHTDDSIAFWHPRTGTLLSGDAVLSVGGRGWITPEVVDAGAGAATADRLRALNVTHLLPGHGRPVLGDDLTATALGPHEGPKGVSSFSTGLLRCLTGRPAGRSTRLAASAWAAPTSQDHGVLLHP